MPTQIQVSFFIFKQKCHLTWNLTCNRNKKRELSREGVRVSIPHVLLSLSIRRAFNVANRQLWWGTSWFSSSLHQGREREQINSDPTQNCSILSRLTHVCVSSWIAHEYIAFSPLLVNSKHSLRVLRMCYVRLPSCSGGWCLCVYVLSRFFFHQKRLDSTLWKGELELEFEPANELGQRKEPLSILPTQRREELEILSNSQSISTGWRRVTLTQHTSN